jgi:hypothetical protein
MTRPSTSTARGGAGDPVGTLSIGRADPMAGSRRSGTQNRGKDLAQNVHVSQRLQANWLKTLGLRGNVNWVIAMRVVMPLDDTGGSSRTSRGSSGSFPQSINVDLISTCF